MNEPTPRREICRVMNGTGRIEVRTDGQEACALFVDGTVRAVDWWADSGSILHDLMLPRTEYSSDWESKFRQTVERCVDPARSLCDQFYSVLHLFPSGTYTLTLTQSKFDDDHWIETPDWLFWIPSGYYPHNAYKSKTIVPTLPETALCEERILEFAYKIENGSRPILITASAAQSSQVAPGSWVEFLLDGHHKARGYFIANVHPWRLLIETTQPELLSYDDWPLPEDTIPRSWQIQFDRDRKGTP